MFEVMRHLLVVEVWVVVAQFVVFVGVVSRLMSMMNIFCVASCGSVRWVSRL